MASELHTTALHLLVERFQKGDALALNELLARAAERLERMARAMLRRYPQVRQREQTADVVQEASLSLLSALRQLTFSSTREFFGLAAEHIRRRLLDLNRRYSEPHRNPLSLAEVFGDPELLPSPDSDSAELDRWQALHEAVANLPADQREVFSLRLYHGWGLQEIADLLQVSTRTVTRLWFRAQLTLTTTAAG